MVNSSQEHKIIFQKLVPIENLLESSLTSIIGQYTSAINQRYKSTHKTDKNILEIKICCDQENECDILPDLIKQRIYYLSIYLNNSTDSKLIDSTVNQILDNLSKLSIQNPKLLYISLENIVFRHCIYNYYDHDCKILFYVGTWNHRKNAKLGEYLLQGLELDEDKIEPEKLLDLLEAPIDEIIKKIKSNGLDVPITEVEIEGNVEDLENEYDEDESDISDQEDEEYNDNDDDDDDDEYIDYSYDYGNREPFAGVDWGDPSTFNEAAWGQFKD